MITSPGIYQIRNTTNGKTYVGSAASLRRRWYEHCSYFRRGAHPNRYLQRAWDKHGAAAFVFEPLFVCAKDMLLFYEQRAIDVMAPAYNLSPTAGNTLGVKHTPETCARMSESRRGVKQKPEHVAARASSNRGKKRTEETKARIAAAATGRACPPETKAKLSARYLGGTLPQETKAKISAALKGRCTRTPGPISEEHKAAISKANLGRKPPPETIAKYRIAARARVQKWRAAIATLAAAMFWHKQAGGVL